MIDEFYSQCYCCESLSSSALNFLAYLNGTYFALSRSSWTCVNVNVRGLFSFAIRFLKENVVHSHLILTIMVKYHYCKLA